MEPTIKTTDIGCAAALICTGNQLIGIEPGTNPNRGVFIFKETPESKKAINDYVCGLQVDALRFSDTLRMLKGRLYDLKHNHGNSR